MQKLNYRGYEVTLSDMDDDKCAGWRAHHWRCIVYDKANRKQMGFDVFGAIKCMTMHPLKALYIYTSDACDFMNINDVEDVMNEFGYEDYKDAKKVFKGLESAYYKCRRFIGSDDDIISICDELREEWG